MDYSLGKSVAQAADLAHESADAFAVVKAAGGDDVRGHETYLWSGESTYSWRGASSFLQRLPQSNRELWLARAAHYRLRSPGGPDGVLYFGPRIRRLVPGI